jgi:hypothetical protein
MNSVNITETSDLVLQVHGTFAARIENRGDSWWQVGSKVYERLRQQLPQNVALAEPIEVFHWSGENSERARIKAATELFARLKELEDRGRHYHLIGHSHGGSVIWHALKMATLNKLELKFLRSWTTVGTPFFKHALPGITRVSNVIRIVLGFLLIKPAYLTAVKFFDLIFRPQSSVWLGHGIKVPDEFTLYDTPVLRLLELAKVPIERVPNGVRIGLLDSTEDFTPFALLTSPTGWLLLVLAVIVITIYLNLAFYFLRPVIESWQVWAEIRLERHARNLYSSRWLGLWSPDDEAINGLRATLGLSVSFISRMSPRDRILFSDHATLLMQPYYWIFAPVFNSLLHPFLDKLIRSIVVKSAQGNNRPGTEVVEIGPVPWKTDTDSSLAPLPDWLNERLVQSANDSAKEVVPQLRALLAAPSFTIALESWGKSGMGGQLVHTSYFDHDELIDLLTMHIAGSCNRENWTEHGTTRQKMKLANWLAEAKSRVDCSWAKLPIGISSQTTTLSEGENLAPIRPIRRINQQKAA